MWTATRPGHPPEHVISASRRPALEQRTNQPHQETWAPKDQWAVGHRTAGRKFKEHAGSSEPPRGESLLPSVPSVLSVVNIRRAEPGRVVFPTVPALRATGRLSGAPKGGLGLRTPEPKETTCPQSATPPIRLPVERGEPYVAATGAGASGAKWDHCISMKA